MSFEKEGVFSYGKFEELPGVTLYFHTEELFFSYFLIFHMAAYTTVLSQPRRVRKAPQRTFTYLDINSSIPGSKD